MEKIANAKDLKRGESVDFPHKGKEGILVKTKQDKLVAYSKVCPHEGGTIVWDASINKLLCECHLSIFNIEDGTAYKYSSLFDKMGNLARIELKIDDKKDIYAV
ncbi:MAG: Rieske 2Fe-2S domain-containing protein [Thermodesulfobacteriota bacterium]|jgi:nitrite reductase/ring-hydroxylating ferredoxin subunit